MDPMPLRSNRTRRPTTVRRCPSSPWTVLSSIWWRPLPRSRIWRRPLACRAHEQTRTPAISNARALCARQFLSTTDSAMHARSAQAAHASTWSSTSVGRRPTMALPLPCTYRHRQQLHVSPVLSGACKNGQCADRIQEGGLRSLAAGRLCRRVHLAPEVKEQHTGQKGVPPPPPPPPRSGYAFKKSPVEEPDDTQKRPTKDAELKCARRARRDNASSTCPNGVYAGHSRDAYHVWPVSGSCRWAARPASS